MSHDIITGVIPVIVGSLITGMVWMGNFLIVARRDLDRAHEKIRAIEKRLKKE